MHSIFNIRTGFLLVLFLCSTVCADNSAKPKYTRTPAQIAEPGLTFGKSNLLPLPRTLLYSAGADEIIADAEAWKKRGIDGFFLNGCARGWENDIWATDGKPWTIGKSDETFQKAKRANEICRSIGSETFLLVTFNRLFDWFDDTAWQHIEHKFRQFAIFAREAGCAGLGIDIEYIMDQYLFVWEGYDYTRYTREELVQTIRSRMTKVAEAMYDEFPDMILLTLPMLDFRLGTHIHVAWIEEAARRQAPGGIHCCFGYSYRNFNIRYVFGRTWSINALFQNLLSSRGKKYWKAHCSFSPGVWPFGHPEYLGHGPELTPVAMREGLAGSLMLARSYNWIYSGGCRQQLMGRNMDAYTREEDIEAYIRVLTEKQIVTTPKYVALTEEFRQMKLRDFSGELGLTPHICFSGPLDFPVVKLKSASLHNKKEREKLWGLAIEYFNGGDVNLQETYATRTNWMLIGPFPNKGDFQGHNTEYPPEKEIDLTAVYDGVNGPVQWTEYKQQGHLASVDLKKVYTPSDNVCAYALCYVTSPIERDVQIRLGTNDSGKLWLGGKLIYDYPYEGGAVLDRDVIQTTLPEGTTPLLLKVCNGELNWGFVFRITDLKGEIMEDIRYSTTLQNK